MKWQPVLALLASSTALAQVLYDPSQGSLPNAQGWSYLSVPLAASLTFFDHAAQLDTRSMPQLLAGFSRVSPVPLDRTHGFTLRFALKVVAEDHGTRVDRAGISVTVLSADKKGIELGFWTDRIWAQSDSPLFTHAEEALWNTTAPTEYILTVLGDQYTLSSQGQTFLTGPLRDYTAFVGTIDPYETANFLFIGDNTTSGKSSIALGTVELGPVLTAPPVLGITRSGDSTILSWPDTTAFFVVLSSPSLDGVAPWTLAEGTAIRANGRMELTLPENGNTRFFRLSP